MVVRKCIKSSVLAMKATQWLSVYDLQPDSERVRTVWTHVSIETSIEGTRAQNDVYPFQHWAPYLMLGLF